MYARSRASGLRASRPSHTGLMPDIPLKTFGKSTRTHTGYTKLQGDEDSEETHRNSREHPRSRNSDTAMPSSSRAALLGKKRLKSQPTDYNDYADEEETLLSNNDREEEFDGRSEPRRRKEASLSVRSVSSASCSFPLAFSLVSRKARTRELADPFFRGVKRRIGLALYHSDLQACLISTAGPQSCSRSVR